MYVSVPDCFMIAFAAGLLFGVVYELFRIVRLILRFKAAVFVCDVMFFIMAALFLCKLSEFLGSYVRLYAVLGFGAGIFAYIVTVGRLFNLLESAASVVWRKTLGRLFRKTRSFVTQVLGKLSQLPKKAFGYFDKYLEAHQKSSQKDLHLHRKKMYNIKKGNPSIDERGNGNVIKAKVTKTT